MDINLPNRYSIMRYASTSVSPVDGLAADLCWAAIQHAETGMLAILHALQNQIMVYSQDAETLYGGYRLQNDASGHCAIVPDEMQVHNIIKGVPATAITATPLRLCDGQLIKQHGLFLLGRLRAHRSDSAVPLRAALTHMMADNYDAGMVLPVLHLSALKSASNTAWLTLHHLQVQQLTFLSEFSRRRLQRDIYQRLIAVAMRAS